MENQNNTSMPYNIFLIGFMGCGKSTVAEELKRRLNRAVLEMDQIIAQRKGMSIPAIFQNYGEEYFRSLETALLVEAQTGAYRIISCGGGVALRQENVFHMRKGGRIILLTASPETILARVSQDNNRPLLQNKKDIASITELMEARRKAYEWAADITISTDEKSAEDISKEILCRLAETSGL